MRRTKNRGFTLVELVAIVVILAAIFLVGFPILLGITKRTNDSTFNTMTDNLCEAGKSYIHDHPEKYPNITTTGTKLVIGIAELIEYGVVDPATVNPKTNETLEESSIVITVEEDQSLSCAFDPRTVTPIPSSELICNPNLVYTGETLELLKEKYEGVIYTNDRATNAGTYTVTASLDPNSAFVWEDTTETSKIVRCTIQKADDQITIVPVSRIYNGQPIVPSVETFSGLSIGKSYFSDSSCNTSNQGKDVGVYHGIITTVGNNNYKPATSDCKLIGTVLPATLTPTVTCNASKIYDGTRNAICTISLTGIIGSDNVTPSGTCLYDNANVGQNKTITCTGITIQGTSASNYVLSTTTASTTGAINNAKLTFSATDGTLSGTSPLYTRKGVSGVYTGIVNSTAASYPTATRTGYTFNGWYIGNTKIINPNGSLVANVSNITDSNGNWLITSDQTLTAGWTINQYKATFYSDLVTNGDFATTSGLGWAAVGGSSTGTVDTSVKNGSLNSMRVRTTGSGWDGIATVYRPSYKNNTTYKLSVKVYRDSSSSYGDVSKDFRVYAPELNSSDGVINYNHGITINTSNLPNKTWKEFSYTFTTSSSGVAFQYVRLDFTNSAGTANIWVSDVRLEEVVERNVTYNTAIGTLPTTTREGHTSGGYYTGTNGSGTQVSASTKIGAADTAYYEKWTSNNYYLDYNGMLDGNVVGNTSGYGTCDIYVNGSQVANDTTDHYTQYPYASTFTINDCKAAAGHTYNGISTNGTSNLTTTLSGTLLTANVSTYANFTTDTYTIGYTLNNGTVATANPTSYTVNTATFTLNNPTRTGYTFKGWTGSNGSTAQTTVTIAKGSTGNRSYTANWDELTATLTYNANGHGTAPSAVTMRYSAATNAASMSNVTGYTFSKWCPNTNGTGECKNAGEQIKAANVIPQSKTLYASWDPVSYSISYTLNGGSATNPSNYTIETETFTLNNPTRSNYTFTGWTGSNGSTAQTTVQIAKGSTGNKSYTANWTPKVYTITLDKQSGSGGTSTIYEKYNTGYYTNSGATTQMTTSANAISAPSRSGYTFSGYYTSPNGGGTQYIAANGLLTSSASSTNFSGNGTLYAYWIKQNSLITYDFNRGTVSFGAGEYLDTGYLINWDKDFKIVVYANVPRQQDKRYLLAGNYVNMSTSRDFSIEVNENGKLRVWLNNAQRKLSSNSIPENTDLRYEFVWTAATDSYTFNAYNGSNPNPVASLSGDGVNMSGTTSYSLRAGTQDHRGSSTYTPYTLKGFNITTTKSYGTLLTDLPTPSNSTATTYQYIGWFTAQSGGNQVTTSTTVPGDDTTYYARWSSNSSNITYRYVNTPVTFNSCEYLDTGYLINWDKDFTIVVDANVPRQQDKRYLLAGNYVNMSTSRDFSIEVNENGKLRVWLNNGERKLSSNSIPANTDLRYVFVWTAATDSYTFNAYNGSNPNPVASLSGNGVNMSGTTSYSLRAGTQDHRGESTYTPYTIGNFSITTTKVYGTQLSDLSTVNGSTLGYNFNGWFTAQSGGSQVTTSTTVPGTDTTYYARLTPRGKSFTPSGPSGEQVTGTGNHKVSGYLVGSTVTFTCTGGQGQYPTAIYYYTNGGYNTLAASNSISSCSDHYTLSATYTITAPTENFTLNARCMFSDDANDYRDAGITGKTIFRRFRLYHDINGATSLDSGSTYTNANQYLIGNNTTEDGGSSVKLYNINRTRVGSAVATLGWHSSSSSMSIIWNKGEYVNIYYGSGNNTTGKVYASNGYQADRTIYAISYDTIPSAVLPSNGGAWLKPGDVAGNTEQKSMVQYLSSQAVRLYNTRRYAIVYDSNGSVLCAQEHSIYYHLPNDSTKYRLNYTFYEAPDLGTGSAHCNGCYIAGYYVAFNVPLNNYTSNGWTCEKN